ncbi:MAG: sugar ABC transporter substrate-binding protein [Tetrasphaera sp.]
MKTIFHRRRWFARPRTLVGLAFVMFGAMLAGCTTPDLPAPIPVQAGPPTSAPPAAATAAATPTPAPVTLRYAFWDARQAPAYAACAEQFMAQHPHITVVIEQTDWPEYWDKLAADLAATAGPDVFVNHTTRLPDLAAGGHLVDIQPLVERDGIDDTIYLRRLPRLWIRAGQRFGLPKDWDAIALVYNKQLLDAAGVTAAEMNALDWNPDDGGSFEQMLARLTVDTAGANALSPTFDAQHVAHYGLTMADSDGGGAYGHQQWSYLAASNGFRFIDYLYADRYHYDDPTLIATLAWYQRLINEQGFHTPFAQIAEQDGRQLFLEGKAAVIADGSWMISQYVNDAPFEVGFARLPVGPQGRKSMFNGLADSIWSGTAHPEEAWLWVQHLGSVACQLTVGDHAVTFPALQSGVDRMIAHYAAQGIDVSAYTAQVLEEDGLFFFPVTEHATEIVAIMQPVIEAILRGEADPASVLPAANDQVNALFAQ